jgi:Clp amino terminal domain, pathogenicity island component
MDAEPQLNDLIDYVVTHEPGGDALQQLSTAVGVSTRLDRLADDLIGYFVDAARLAGASWTEIGQHLGVTKQAAQQRFVPKQDDETEFLTKRRLRRFTDRARRVARQAKMAAERRGDTEVRNEHVVLGLLTEPDGLAARAMVALGAPLERVSEVMRSALGPAGEPTRGRVRFSDDAKKTLELALREAVALGHEYIGTEHILLGLLHNETDSVAKELVRLGVTRQRTEDWVLAVLAAAHVSRRRRQA